MKRHVILLLTTLLAGRSLFTGVGSSGAQVPVGTGTSSSSSVTLSTDYTSVEASDFSGVTGYSITAAGKFVLSESVTDNDATTALVSIAADDVTFDLGGHSINGGGASVGIVVSGTRHNITIKNGTIRDVITTGVAIPTAITELTLEDLTINNCSGNAIEFAGTSFSSYLKNITITSDSTATGKGIEVIGTAQNFYLDTFSIDSLSGTGMHALEFTAASHGITIKNGRITDIGTGATTDAINFGAASYDIEINNINISKITGQGIDLNDSYNVSLKDITIANIAAGSGIEIGDAGYDITMENFKISNITTVAPLDGGIKFGTGAYGIILNTGSVNTVVSGVSSSNGLSFTGTSYGVQINNVAINNIANRGIDLNSSYGVELNTVNITNTAKGGIVVGVGTVSRDTKDITLKNCLINKTTGASTKGIQCLNVNNIVMENITVQNTTNTTSASDVVGVLLNTCTDIKLINVNSGGHYGNGAQGFKLININGGYLNNCQSQGNTATDQSQTYTCAGFLVETSTAVRFVNCNSSGHEAPREAQGFLFSNAIGSYLDNCSASGIRVSLGRPVYHEHPRFIGFFSVNGVSNYWKDCSASNNYAGNVTSSDGDGAIGFYLSSETQSSLVNCLSQGHGARYNHKAHAIGFYLDDAISRVGMAKSDCSYCFINNCNAFNNCTSDTSGENTLRTAYGIRDDSTDTTNVIINCTASGNKNSASPLVSTNYWMDLPIGGTDKSSWPITSGTMDSLIEFANLPKLYNIDIE